MIAGDPQSLLWRFLACVRTKVRELSQASWRIDRTSEEWRELSAEASRCQRNFAISGKSGLITPERKLERQMRRYEKTLRKKYQKLPPALATRFIENYRAAARK